MNVSKFLEWAGNGDHFLGFARIVGVFLVLTIVVALLFLL